MRKIFKGWSVSEILSSKNNLKKPFLEMTIYLMLSTKFDIAPRRVCPRSSRLRFRRELLPHDFNITCEKF